MAMEPANTLIEYLGGAKALARVLGKHVSRVYGWTYPIEKGGTGGLIPAREQKRILEFAQSEGVDLQPADFFEPDRVRALIATSKTSEAAE